MQTGHLRESLGQLCLQLLQTGVRSAGGRAIDDRVDQPLDLMVNPLQLRLLRRPFCRGVALAAVPLGDELLGERLVEGRIHQTGAKRVQRPILEIVAPYRAEVGAGGRALVAGT